jgi:hypothetical protein
MKVALCFIISYQHVLNKEQLWIDWIKPNQDILNVYFHYKDINLIKSPWIKMYSIPPEYTHQTTYYNVVPAYMSLLSYAFKHDTENIWFSMLTDSCVPIISPAKFRRLFFENYQASIFKWQPAYWNINLHRRANLRLLKKELRLANDPWFTLTRQHVHKCIIFMVGKHGLYEQINEGGLANESIFAIMLQTFDILEKNTNTLLNEQSNLTDWTRMSSPTSPYLFKEATEENLNIIKKLLKENKYSMFLRKVDKSFPNEALLEIMEAEFDHKYDVLYNHAKKKDKLTFVSKVKKYVTIAFVNSVSYVANMVSNIVAPDASEYIIPKANGRYICIMSLFGLISGICAIKEGLYNLAIAPVGIFITSVNYWRKPVYGLRRNVDLVYVTCSLIYHILYSIRVQYAAIYCSIITIAFLCWPLSWYFYRKKYIWTSTILQSMIHFVGNIANISLIYCPNHHLTQLTT